MVLKKPFHKKSICMVLKKPFHKESICMVLTRECHVCGVKHRI